MKYGNIEEEFVNIARRLKLIFECNLEIIPHKNDTENEYFKTRERGWICSTSARETVNTPKKSTQDKIFRSVHQVNNEIE